jgi:hypothetical protein
MTTSPGFDPSLGNDGGCSGFQWAERLFSGISACCVDHDLGATDGQLLDCLFSVMPGWAWPLACLALAVMVMARPLYMHGQRKGWWK